jgi:hypothetical protein
MRRLALAIAVFALAAQALPPGVVEAKVRQAASIIARDCAPERHDEFVDRFERTFVETLMPMLELHERKLNRSAAALETARESYIGCIRKAREQDRVPREACAAEGEHFRERDATARTLRSPEVRQELGRAGAPRFARALQPLVADFPQCDLRRLKDIRP